MLSITDVMVTLRQQDDPFYGAIADIIVLHERKSADYGTPEDAHANIRSSERWGIPSWQGALLRRADKDVRIQQWLRKGALANESIEDSMLDQAVYAVIAWAEWKRDHARGYD